jgi:F-type H+-transporting ATPase subunit delta
MSNALSARYAKAFVDILFEPTAAISPEAALQELQDFEAMSAHSADLKHILDSPAISRARKRAVIGQVAQSASLSPLVRNFLFVVVDRGRAAMLSELRKAVETMIDERRGIARAHVSSDAELPPAEQSAIAAQLSRISGKQVICDFKTDPELLGGVIARIGSTLYDGSVRGKLATLKSRLSV